MTKKMSLMMVLEDIDPKKFKREKVGVTEKSSLGLQAFGQAYNRLIYDGIINAPVLNIFEKKKDPNSFPANTGDISYKKQAFDFPIDPSISNVDFDTEAS